MMVFDDRQTNKQSTRQQTRQARTLYFTFFRFKMLTTTKNLNKAQKKQQFVTVDINLTDMRTLRTLAFLTNKST